MVIAVLYPLGISAKGIEGVVRGLESVECWQARARLLHHVAAGDRRRGLHGGDGEQSRSGRYACARPTISSNGVSTLRRDAPKAFRPILTDTTTGSATNACRSITGSGIRSRSCRAGVGAAGSAGVQRSAQFADLLPRFIAADLRQMDADSLYSLSVRPDTLVSGRRCAVVDAVMTVRGYVCSEVSYTFDAATMLPLAMEADYNPGALSEQMVSVRYDYAGKAGCHELSEQFLIERYPGVFEKYRQSNFRIENLPGTRMPGFALPTTTGERYSRQAGDPFRAPTVVVLLEAGSEFTPQLIAGMREAVDPDAGGRRCDIRVCRQPYRRYRCGAGVAASGRTHTDERRHPWPATAVWPLCRVCSVRSLRRGVRW